MNGSAPLRKDSPFVPINTSHQPVLLDPPIKLRARPCSCLSMAKQDACEALVDDWCGVIDAEGDSYSDIDDSVISTSLDGDTIVGVL